MGLAWAAGRARPLRPDTPLPVPPPLPPGRVVTVPGRAELFVRDLPGPRAPPSPPILLLHAFMYPSDVTWFGCYAPLGGVGRVLATDFRGHGRGPRPATPFRLVDVADDVAALIRTLETGPVIAVGYSLGGAIAQLLWRRHPDVVAGLVLCATSASFSTRAQDRWIWRAMGVLQLGLRVLPRPWWEQGVALQAAGRLPRIFTRMIHPETPQELLELLPWLFGEVDRGSAEDIAEAGRELGRYDARDWLHAVDVPTAVLITARDRLVPPAGQHDLADRIPGASKLVLDADHDGVVAAAEDFVPLLVEAVRAVAAAASDTRAGGSDTRAGEGTVGRVRPA